MSGYYMPGDGLGLGNLGRAAAQIPNGALTPLADDNAQTSPWDSPAWQARMAVWSVVSTASAGLSAYHGYKRNRGSVGWAIGWAFLGGLFPVITPAIAFAQGFGKPKVKSNRRRRRRRTSRRRAATTGAARRLRTRRAGRRTSR